MGALDRSPHAIGKAHVGLHWVNLPNVAHGLQVSGQIRAAHSGAYPPAIERQRFNRMATNKARATKHRDEASLLQPRDHRLPPTVA